MGSERARARRKWRDGTGRARGRGCDGMKRRATEKSIYGDRESGDRERVRVRNDREFNGKNKKKEIRHAEWRES